MYNDEVTITFKHYRTGENISMNGILPEVYNPENSDLYVLMKQDGTLEDIRKESVVEILYGVVN